MKKQHRSLLVLAGLIGVQAGFIGIGYNCISVLLSAVMQDTGFMASQLSVYYTIYTLASAVSVNFLSQCFFRGKGHFLLAALGVISAFSIGVMGWVTQVWQSYITAAFAGFAGCLCLIAAPIITNNWFRHNRGLVNGIVMAASGIAGAVFSPVCSALISRFGWRPTCLVLMGLILILVCLPCLLVVRAAPDGSGVPVPHNAAQSSDCLGKAAVSVRHTPPALALLLFFVLFMPRLLTQFCVQVPTYALSLGMPVMMAGTLTSLLMCGNIAGKLLFGFLLDKLGIRRVITGVYLLTAAAFVLLLAGGAAPLYLYVGTVCIGGIYALNTIGGAMLFLKVYGPTCYRKELARRSVAPMALAAFSSPAIALAYDTTGSYDGVLAMAALCCAAMAAALQTLTPHHIKGGSLHGIQTFARPDPGRNDLPQ